MLLLTWLILIRFYSSEIAVVLPLIEIELIMPEIVCANAEPEVTCGVDLCLEASCAAFPLAVCKIDACGVCSAVFTDLLTGFVVDCGKRAAGCFPKNSSFKNPFLPPLFAAEITLFAFP